MAGVKTFQLRFNPTFLDQFSLLSQPIRRAKVNHVSEVDTSTIQRTHLRQELANRSVTFFWCLNPRARSSSCRGIKTRNKIPTPASCDIDDDIGLGIPNPVHHLAIMLNVMTHAARFWISDMNVSDR